MLFLLLSAILNSLSEIGHKFEQKKVDTYVLLYNNISSSMLLLFLFLSAMPNSLSEIGHKFEQIKVDTYVCYWTWPGKKPLRSPQPFGLGLASLGIKPQAI